MHDQSVLSGPASEVSRYLPRYLTTRAAEFVGGQPTPSAFPLWATAVMADISGFTALTERFARQGAGGLERLTLALNNCIGRINTITVRHGGDIDAFSGDAVLALWISDGTDRSDCALRAAQCAADLIREVDGHQLAEGITLRLRVAAVSGELTEMYIGGHEGRWKSLISGRALFELSNLLDRIAPAQFAADSATLGLLGRGATSTILAKGSAFVTGLTGGAAALVPTLPPPARGNPATLFAFLPRVLAARAGSAQQAWAAEVRTITTMFASLTGIQVGAEGDLSMIQSSVAQAQAVVYRYGGSIHSVAMNDKGPMIMVIFGLPHCSHEDDACRAVLAARELQAILGAMWLDSTCGIATGPAYCGPLGSDERRTYSVVGASVNLASRLQSNGRYRVLCDQATMTAASGRIRFERMPDMQLKGMKDAVEVFCPRQDIVSALPGRHNCIGRESESLEIAEALRGFGAANRTGAIILKGEAGIGKSCLIAQAISLAEGMGYRVLAGAADPYNQQIPFQSWRRPFARLLGIEGIADPAAARIMVTDRIAAMSALAGKAALVSAVLPFEIPDTQITVEMRGAARLDSTIRALCDCLEHALDGQPTLVVLDDVHWQDSASWGLIRALLRDLGNVRFLLATRPLFEATERQLADTTLESETKTMILQPFSERSTSRLIADAVGVAQVQEGLCQFIQGKSGGNPFYITELALALTAAGAVRIEADEARLGIPLAELEMAGFPDSIERTVLTRFDQLPHRQQLILKFASVIGAEFHAAMIAALFPQLGSPAQIEADLQHLATARLLDPRPGPSRDLFQFNHAIARDVIYGLLLQSDRQSLHRAVADLLRTEGDHALLPAVAMHYFRAEAFEQAAECFELSGIGILTGGTNRESIALLDKALESLRLGKLTVDPLRRARIHRHLGEAHNRLGLLPQAFTHLETGLSVLGMKWPARVTGIAVGTTTNLARQALRQTLGRLGRARDDRVARAEEASHILDHMGHTLFFLNRGFELVLLVCAQVNLAEDSRNRRLQAHAYLQFSNVMGIFGAHKVARFYQRKFAPYRPELPTPDLARCNQLQSLYLGATGDFGQCRALLEEALAIADEIGDQRFRREFTSLLGIVALPLGQLDEAEQRRASFLELTETSGDVQARAWALIEMAEIALYRGQTDAAISWVERVVPLLDRLSPAEMIWSHGILARAHLEAGDMARALDTASRTLETIRRALPVGYYTYEGYAGVAEVFVTALEQGAIGAERAALRRAATRAVKALSGFARSFPFVLPRLLILAARLEAVLGRAGKACARLPEAAELARALRMPLEEAAAHLALAATAAAPQDARGGLLTAARSYRAQGCALGMVQVARVARRLGIADTDALPKA